MSMGHDMEVAKKRKITDDAEIEEYIVKKAIKFAKKLKANKFVWRKKIEYDIKSRRELAVDELFSAEAQRKRQIEREIELERVRERRQGQMMKAAALHRRRSIDDGERADEFDRDEEELRKSPAKKVAAQVLDEDGDDAVLEAEAAQDSVHLQKPKYSNRIRTGYDWNKYNRTHYDGENPPPKAAEGCKFNIFYPDLIQKSRTPSYSLERDGESGGDTCIIRFHAGAPYQDLAFRIVNREWDYSPKNGFKCTFDGGILRLYFNLKRLRYRR